jgi:hypothetical protein
MKLIIVAILCFICHWAVADEYRYNFMVTNGLQERVFDRDGAETTIVFSKKSNEEARFLLTMILELGGINGTKGVEKWNGVPFEQVIILRGRLDPTIRRTASAPNAAEAEDYKEFTLDEVLIRFPLVRHRQWKVFDTAFLETHFSFDILFPDSVDFKGRRIDFARHTAKSEQDGAGEPSTRLESKSEGSQKPQPDSEGRSR